MKTAMTAIALVFFATFAQAGDWYTVPNSDHDFRIDYSLGNEDPPVIHTVLYIWSGQTQTITGFTTLSVTDAEAPEAIIRDWYNTMVAFQLSGDRVRITYDSATGKIRRIIPL